MNIFGYTDYREIIRAWIQSREKSHGLHVKLCRAMECQSAHLSRVLQDKIHLTLDQAHLLSEYMALTEAESIYFMKLVEFQRAGNYSYRKKLDAELKQLRKDQENFIQRHKLKKIEQSEFEMIYYSSWHWTAIHYLTGIKRYQSSTAIAHRLSLSELVVNRTLEKLEKMGLVKKSGDLWKLVPGSIHLPKDSPMYSVSHANWRHRALLSSQDPNNDDLHYTVVQAISESDFEKIKQILLKTIDDYKSCANPSPSEELICFSLDYFKV